jgi:hypothetical protein
MTAKLKALIFGDRNVIQDGKHFSEIKQLFRFLISKDIVPIIYSNDLTPERVRLEKSINENYSNKVVWYIAERDATPKKPKADAIGYVLSKMWLEKNEVIYVGNTDTDMQTAVNGGVLFLNATWYGKNNDYGFEFDSPFEIARFVDIFCLRDNLWFYHINSDNLEYYSPGTYAYLEQQYTYSRDAKEAAKYGRGKPDFWIKYLLSTVYFSGLCDQIDYIAPYPGHEKDSILKLMRLEEVEKTVADFAKCFRINYLRDLIIRHTTSLPSSQTRNKGGSLNHRNQLQTISLNRLPLKNLKGERYKSCPLKTGKTVLILDDICTEGYSFEAARVYIEQTGAKVICLSLLKTIGKNYTQIGNIGSFSPFQANPDLVPERVILHPYSRYTLDSSTHQEITSKLEAYDSWQWDLDIL